MYLPNTCKVKPECEDDYDFEYVHSPHIIVHGGITYVHHNSDKRAWCIGFDCAQTGDYSPHPDMQLSIYMIDSQYNGYKTVEYCLEQCRLLAKQLKDLQDAC